MKNKNPHRGTSLDEFLEEERKKEIKRRAMRELIIALIITFFAVCLLIWKPALAKANTTIYIWQTTDNIKAFTDNSKQIPSKYRNHIEQMDIKGLKDYYRYTPVQNEKEYREKLIKRLKELRSK